MIITICGENDYLIKTELSKLVKGHISKYGDLGVEQFDNETDKNNIYESLSSFGLFSTNKLIVLNDISLNKEITENFEERFSDIPEGTTVVLVEHKLDKRSVFYKYISKNTDFRNFNKLDSSALNNWILSYVKNNGGEISYSEARYLIERAGDNQLKLSNEINKLLLFNKKISTSSIDLLIEQSYQNNIFQLIDSVFNGNIKAAIAVFNNLRQQKLEAPQMIATICWQLNQVALMKYAGDRSIDEVASDSNQKPFILSNSRAMSNKLSTTQIKSMVKKLLDIDVESKSVAIDTDEAIKNYILELSTL